MKTNISINDKNMIVSIAGEIDHHSASEIKADIAEAYAQSMCINIIFDFGGLYFMDSAGIGMIIGRYKQACINGGDVYATGISPAIERIFELSGLNKIIKRCDTVEQALSSCRCEREVI